MVWYDKIEPRNEISTINLGTKQIFIKIGGDGFSNLFSGYQKFQMGG